MVSKIFVHFFANPLSRMTIRILTCNVVGSMWYSVCVCNAQHAPSEHVVCKLKHKRVGLNSFNGCNYT